MDNIVIKAWQNRPIVTDNVKLMGAGGSPSPVAVTLWAMLNFGYITDEQINTQDIPITIRITEGHEAGECVEVLESMIYLFEQILGPIPSNRLCGETLIKAKQALDKIKGGGEIADK